jgi:membrane protein
MNLLHEGWQIVKEASLDWMEDKAAQLGAALAFYSVLSLAPLLVLSIAAAALFFGEEAARGQIVEQLRGLIGAEGAVAIEAMINSAQKLETGSLAAVLGLAVLLFGASGVFGQLQDSLNTIWEAPPRVGPGIWGFIRDRFLSFAMVVCVGFLLLVSLVLSAAIAGLGTYLGNSWPGLESVGHLASSAVTFVMATFLFALIYKVLPDVKIAWRDVWIGAALTAALFTIGKLLIGLYLGKSGIASAYGAGGSLIVLVLWLYYSAQILLFGAELTQVCARRYGSRILPHQATLPFEREKHQVGT